MYAEYAPGEVAGNSGAGRASAVASVYNDGTFSIGGSYTARQINPSRPFSDVLATALPTSASTQDMCGLTTSTPGTFRIGSPDFVTRIPMASNTIRQYS